MIGTWRRRTWRSNGRITSPWVHSTASASAARSRSSTVQASPSGASNSFVSMDDPVCDANGSSVCTHLSAGLLTRRRIGVSANVSTRPDRLALADVVERSEQVGSGPFPLADGPRMTHEHHLHRAMIRRRRSRHPVRSSNTSDRHRRIGRRRGSCTIRPQSSSTGGGWHGGADGLEVRQPRGRRHGRIDARGAVEAGFDHHSRRGDDQLVLGEEAQDPPAAAASPARARWAVASGDCCSACCSSSRSSAWRSVRRPAASAAR